MTTKTTTTITAQAADTKRGMTLRELLTFVEQATKASADLDQVVTVRATWRTTIREATVTADGPAEAAQRTESAPPVYWNPAPR